MAQGQVLALLDATGTFFKPAALAFPGADAGAWAKAAAVDPGAAGPHGAWLLDFRCFAVPRPGGRWLLVDAGVGPAEGPGAEWCPVPGRLPWVLADAGIDPADVETVVLTHLHEDHVGWSMAAKGEPMFPGARYVVQRAETEALDRQDPVWDWVVQPLCDAGQLQAADGALRLGGGVELLPTPGHTPGHQSVLVTGQRPGDRDVMITGDALVHAVQLADPAVAYAHERDPAAARVSREALLALAVERRALLGTAHLTRSFVEPSAEHHPHEEPHRHPGAPFQRR
ncbi:MBL fold metallo-hydrolase [Streptomyces sp. NPDC015127]|uniref:MBL fold metallo-hydrolase n=1 Tax=Streptomyces sp. NPDC015127 TaxID=3364939 RepID=UPI003701D263